VNTFKNLLKTDKTGLINGYCHIPWTDLLINENGLIYPCGCEGWLKKSIGNILEIKNKKDLSDILFNNIIKQSILDQSYKFCHGYKCSFIQNSYLNKKSKFFVDSSKDLTNLYLKNIWLQIDESCNLACPTCRNNVIINKNNSKTKKIKTILDKLEDFLLNEYKEQITIRLVGNGELFASPTLLSWFLKFDFKRYNNVNFLIHSNGTLLNKHKDYLLSVANNLSGFEISTDATSKETYSIVRKNGEWEDLLKGYEVLDELRKIQPDFYIASSFVISSLNYFEIPNMIKFSKDRNTTLIFYKVLRWSMDVQKFDSLNIFSPKHPKHNDFLSVISKIDFSQTSLDTNIFTFKI